MEKDRFISVRMGSGSRPLPLEQERGNIGTAEAVVTLQHAQHARMLGTLTSTRNETVETYLLN
jgi:hypothetical protein